MDSCFDQFSVLIDSIESQQPEIIKFELKEVYQKFKSCNKKLVSASKFIDFFAHDILDYTILKKDSKKFKP